MNVTISRSTKSNFVKVRRGKSIGKNPMHCMHVLHFKVEYMQFYFGNKGARKFNYVAAIHFIADAT